eukprot:scaffold13177_cov70-Cyclotella_meneghiniana.AAC.3
MEADGPSKDPHLLCLGNADNGFNRLNRMMVETWVAGIVELAKVARKYPQSTYAGVTQCLQSEWQYVCRVDPGVGSLLKPVEDALVSSFLPALFDFKQDQKISDSFRELLGNAVKQGGLVAIRNPTVGASRLH